MQLRKATKEDFEICKKLDESMFDDVLFVERSKDDESSEKKMKSVMDSETFESVKAEMEFTKMKFEKHLEDDYVKIFVFEDDDENVIGYVRMFRITRFRWKLETMQVLEDFQTEEVIMQILNELLKEKNVQEIEIGTTSEEMQRRLSYLGYQESPKSLWYFLIKEELE